MVLTRDRISRPGEGIQGVSIVIFVEDEPTLRAAFVKITNAQPDFRVVGQAGDGVLGLELYMRYKPDIVVTNIAMPLMDGLTLTRKIVAMDPDGKVMILSAQGTRERIQQGLEAGARLYLTKPVSEKEFLNALRAVASGETPNVDPWK